jgi:hypothetical protein
MITISKPLIEAIKEPLRYILIAVVSYLLTETVIEQVILLVFGAGIDPATKLMITGLLTALLRGIDKWLHEIGLDKGPDSLIKGLTRF